MFIHGWLVDVNIIKIKIKPYLWYSCWSLCLRCLRGYQRNVRGALHFERYHLIAWLLNQMIRREAVVACRRCFVTSQTVIKYGGCGQSNLILFGSCSCTSFLRGKKETTTKNGFNFSGFSPPVFSSCWSNILSKKLSRALEICIVTSSGEVNNFKKTDHESNV